MGIFNIRSRISGRLPSLPSRGTRQIWWLYTKILLAVAAMPVGLTLAISGITLLPLMALAGEILAIIGASAMLAIGLSMIGGAYIWLTSPA